MTGQIQQYASALLKSEWDWGVKKHDLGYMFEYADFVLFVNGGFIYDKFKELSSDPSLERKLQKDFQLKAKKIDAILRKSFEGPFQEFEVDLKNIARTGKATKEQLKRMDFIIDSLKLVAEGGRISANSLRDYLDHNSDFSAEQVFGEELVQLSEGMSEGGMKSVAHTINPAVEQGGMFRNMMHDFEIKYGSDEVKGVLPEVIAKLEGLKTMLQKERVLG